MAKLCAGQMAAVLETACRDYHKAGGKVDEEFFPSAAALLTGLCHPESFVILSDIWEVPQVVALRERLLTASAMIDINKQPELRAMMRTTAFVLDTFARNNWGDDWPAMDPKASPQL